MKAIPIASAALCCLLVSCADTAPVGDSPNSTSNVTPTQMFARVTAYRMGGKGPERYKGKKDWWSYRGIRGDGGRLTYFNPAKDQIGSAATNAVPQGWLVIIHDDDGNKFFVVNDVPGRAVLSRDAAITLARRQGRLKEHPYAGAKVIDCCTPGGKEPTSPWATVSLLPPPIDRPYHELTLAEKAEFAKISTWEPTLKKAGFYK